MTNPYRKSVRHLDEIDIYQIGNLYEVKSHAVFHAIKKLLCAGKRGAKDYEQDLMEAIESVERELQIICEDEDEVERGPYDHTFSMAGAAGRMRRKSKRELAGMQDCGFTPTFHAGMPLDPEPDWDHRHPDLRFAVRGEDGQFVYSKDAPSGGEFWSRPVEEKFDEQRIDAIGQNGNEGEHYEPSMTLNEVLKTVLPDDLVKAFVSDEKEDWRMKVDWRLASPHHQWASKKPNGDYGFSMHEPMEGEYIRRPTAQ